MWEKVSVGIRTNIEAKTSRNLGKNTESIASKV